MNIFTILQVSENVVRKSADMAVRDPHGVTITLVSVAVVFLALVVLYFAYAMIGKAVNGKFSLKKPAKKMKSGVLSEEEAAAIIEAAKYVDSLGCFEIVLEHIPEELGTKITGMVNAVTIGIGGGKFTDGQVLVMHDALGMHQRKLPPFATKFVDMYSLGVEGFKKYIESVNSL